MRSAISISEISYEPAPDGLRSTGLIGFVRVLVNDSLVIDGVTIRELRDGGVSVSWPRRNGGGGTHRLVYPLSPVRAALEGEILARLRAKGALS